MDEDFDITEFHGQYGERLARRLACIGHTDDRKAFLPVADLDNAIELLKAARSSLKADTSVLLWEEFLEDLDDAGRDNYHSMLTGSVAVIRKAGTDIRAQRQAVHIGRSCLKKVIGLMLRDAYMGELATHYIRFKVNGISGQEIQNLGDGWWGYGFEITWTVPLDLTVTEADLLPLA